MGETRNIGSRFKKIAAQQKDAPALAYPSGETVSYLELDQLSDQIASSLLHEGVQIGDVVAIFNQKSRFGFASMLGCLKIGAIYCNLDTSSPQARLSKILDRCQPRLILKDQVDGLSISLDSADSNIEINTVDANAPAYIMFTSGSTGFPKGAVMSHQNVLNLADWAKETYEITSADNLSNVNPVYFDNSVFDFYAALLNGATILPFTQDEVNEPINMVQKMNELQCTLWFSVPSLLVYLLTTKSLTDNDFKSMRFIAFGGEGFPKPQLKKLYEMFGQQATLMNVYGPTECTCICSARPIEKKDFEDMKRLAPLGKLAPMFDYELLNEEEGIGELCLIGPNVGMGYYNDPERTDRAFIPCRSKEHSGEIMYRTGDLVWMDSAGEFHFKGRIDNQVKHMGYRIELEEIEEALNALKYVNEAGVIYRSMGAGMGQIRAFVAASAVEGKDVLLDLKDLLPPYMLPSRITVLETLPKNRNGKIDRKQLKEL